MRLAFCLLLSLDKPWSDKRATQIRSFKLDMTEAITVKQTQGMQLRKESFSGQRFTVCRETDAKRLNREGHDSRAISPATSMSASQFAEKHASDASGAKSPGQKRKALSQ